MSPNKNKPQQTKVDEIQGPSPNHKKCTECGIQMLQKNFARHMRDMHTATPKPRSPCPLCQKSYKTQDWLKDHIRRGHGYTKELTDQVMASLETKNSTTTNSESQMKKLSLEETKLPPLINLKEPSTSVAMIDIAQSPITILASHTVVKEEEADQMPVGSNLVVEDEVPEIDDEFCAHLLPEIEDEFWDGTTQKKRSPLRKEANTTWIESFGIPCSLCAIISDNKSDLKKHIQTDHGLTLFQYRSRCGPAGPRQKFK